MLNVLVSDSRSAEISEHDDLYGWLVGVWDVEVRDLLPDGSWREGRGEWHFARVLEGRAVQDVWIAPPLAERRALREFSATRFGTSIRWLDRQLGAWRVSWINPASGGRNDLVGRRDGERIVQEGRGADGRPIRWCFGAITPSSFQWTGEAQTQGETGDVWLLEAEFRARRRG